MWCIHLGVGCTDNNYSGKFSYINNLLLKNFGAKSALIEYCITAFAALHEI
jgi:hypothetical protein